MRLVQGYSEVEKVLATTESTLRIVSSRPVDDTGFHVISTMELEQLNNNIKATVEFIKVVKQLGMDNLHASLQLEKDIVEQLNNEAKPYIYATMTYSKDSLAQYDEFTAASIKRILREYFAKSELTYEGWN